jgi:8-oxo-dGTP pyrophosphatase MutT (NUDIX family)
MAGMSDWWTGIEGALGAHCAPEPDDPPAQRSGVAAILAFRPAPEVLLMRRVVHERDPWSGQVSLPGGRRSRHDSDLLETAVRETREEVAVDLGKHARLLGRLAPRRAISRGRRLAMDVTPFVFRLEREVEPTPLEEAESLFWLPLDRAAAGELDGEHRYERDDVVHRMPCWKHEGYVVWGLTYRILTSLLEICRES